MFHRPLVAALLAIGFLAGSGAHAATTVIFNVFTGPRHFINEPFKEWAKEVERVTEGRVTIRFLPASAAPPPKQLDAAVSGQFDAAFIFNAFTKKHAPGAQFALMPFILEGNSEQGSVAYWRAYRKFFGDKDEFADDGVHVLSLFQFAGGSFVSGTDTPITSLADLKSRKIWALAGTPSQVLEAAGVDHVSGPAARMSEFTQTNVVEAVVGTSMDAIIAFGAKSFAQSATTMPGKIQSAAFTMFISRPKWNEISAADRKAIMEVSGEKVARAVGRRANMAEEKARKELMKAGVQFVESSESFREALRTAGEPIIKKWVETVEPLGVDGRAVLEAYKSEVRNLAGGSGH